MQSPGFAPSTTKFKTQTFPKLMKHTESPRTSESTEEGLFTHDRGITHEQTVAGDSGKGRPTGWRDEQRLRALAALAEPLDPIANTRMVPHNTLQL